MNDQYTMDLAFMQIALDQARQAACRGEVPVGAALVHGETLLAVAANRPIATNDPTAHAEILAIREAAEKIGNYRLVDTTLYVTLEPCIMCMGAIVHARIQRLVFGALDPKTGAAQSRYTIGLDGLLNHRLEITGGVLGTECSSMLKDFFKQRRAGRQEENER
ncbi:MAG: tRNA adenosine(34) deaminase TadA [Proteobacteria bacterium]|nr:tRNA adenosine(34) deaminase TadA [Pseudomonadota bacterium]MBU1649016.1 tRNA adenosine(34) deaminase TadA [Pseudomonadota bacterium]MBU1986256.1 tRNA adenosine(34) deaminase TadA [Pseudomonadota bacterium]